MICSRSPCARQIIPYERPKLQDPRRNAIGRASSLTVRTGSLGRDLGRPEAPTRGHCAGCERAEKISARAVEVGNLS